MIPDPTPCIGVIEMAFISVIDPEAADDRLAQLYRRVASADGQVDNVLKVHGLRPHTLEGHMALYKAVLHHTGNQLPVWFLEVIGVLVSQLNECAYCEQHHTAGLRRLLDDDQEADAWLGRLQQLDSLEPTREMAALRYARQLTLDPGGVTQGDIDALRSAGLDEGEILEVNQVAAYFAYANRTVSGLGVNREGEVLGLSPPDGDDLEAWDHD